MKKIKFTKKSVVVMIIVLIVASVATYLFSSKSESGFTIETVKVEKGSVSNTITATGTLQATDTVVVGTQVSGVIQKLYVDFNSNVRKGQLIAELDKSTLQYSLENAEADVDNSEAEYNYQKSNYERMQELYNKGFLSQSDYDLAEYTYKKSEANLKSAKANQKRAEQDLSYATIYSPIDGVVLNCAVEEGQTVAASMSTPELFTIVNDLTTMQVEANIDEADIGMVEEGQRVEFTVDAFPDETFDGVISEVRLQPTSASNVITYPVIIKVSNPELKLKPGLTASITTYVEEANDVLVISEKATSFEPSPDVLHSYMSQFEANKSLRPNRIPDGDRNQGNPPEMDDSHKIVWVKTNNDIRPVEIETGIADGSNVEVLSGIEENSEVLVVLSSVSGTKTKKESNDAKSPFVQERKRGSGNGGPQGPPPQN